MRQTISGLVAAIAVMTAGAAPAMACGYTSCSPCTGYVSPCAQSYVPTYTYAPTYTYTGCTAGCGGWGYERLVEPTTQYYYVNQGPTYSGPGAFAPYPTYRENALPAWGAEYSYRRSYRYGYAPRYGYRPRHYGYGPRYYGYPLRRLY